jgi:hypothetical protein
MFSKLSTCCAVVVGLLAASAPAHAGKSLTSNQKLALSAARALYGEGLSIKRTRRGVTIAPKPGGLTQKRFNTYVEKFYLPALARMRMVSNGRSFRFLTKPRDAKYDPSAKVKLAHVLLEPDLKFTLCQKIEDVAGIGWRDPYTFASDDRKNWCLLHALREATSPILEYRGKKVHWDGKRERGDLRVDDVIFAKGSDGNYPIVVTVAGGRTHMTRAAYRIAQQLVGSIGKQGTDKKLIAKIRSLWSSRSRAYNKLVKRMVAKQRRYAKRKPILFSAEYFAEWVARKPAKKSIPCDSSHYLIYTPRRGGEGSYAKVMKVNGAICSVVPLDANHLDRGSFHNSMKCGGHFESGKTYQLGIDIHRRHVTGSYSKVEWRHKKWKNAKYDLSRLGKRLHRATIKCVAK